MNMAATEVEPPSTNQSAGLSPLLSPLLSPALRAETIAQALTKLEPPHPRLRRTQSWPPSSTCLGFFDKDEETGDEIISNKWVEYVTIRPETVVLAGIDDEHGKIPNETLGGVTTYHVGEPSQEDDFGLHAPPVADDRSTKTLAGSAYERRYGFRAMVQKQWAGTQQWIQHMKSRREYRRHRHRHGDRLDPDEDHHDSQHTPKISLEEAWKPTRPADADGRASTDTHDKSDEPIPQQVSVMEAQSSITFTEEDTVSKSVSPAHQSREITSKPSRSTPTLVTPSTVEDEMRVANDEISTPRSPRVTIVESKPIREKPAELLAVERWGARHRERASTKPEQAGRRRKVTNPPHELSKTPIELADEQRGRHRDLYLKEFSSTGEMIVTREQPRRLPRHRTASGARSSWKQPPPGIVRVAEEDSDGRVEQEFASIAVQFANRRPRSVRAASSNASLR